MKNKAFTLIELLAVIIILGILMLIAIPSVTSYINNSRKETYVDTVNEVLRGASILVNSGDIEVNDPNATYYVPIDAIKTENGEARSPYGKYDQAYIVITYDGEEYDYYFVGKDEADIGVPTLTKSDSLDKDSIESNINDINTNVGIGDRDKIVVLKNDLTIDEEKNATDFISDSIAVYPEGKNKKTVTTGDKVYIGNEQFYVVKHDGNNLILIARYNLKVGIISNRSTNEIVREYTSSDEGYGLQSSECVGYKDSLDLVKGTVKFANSTYWNGKVGEGKKYPGNLSGMDYPYVYDENSNLYTYVENYRQYLETQGMRIKEARLLSFDEAVELGCEAAHFCSDSPSFVYSTTYWLGNVEWYSYGGSTYYHYGWVISPDKRFFAKGYEASSYNSNKISGVRPVIVI